MLNAMGQGRSGSMCTIHADSSAGVFRRIASYAVQAPERLPLEASNLLIAGAVHFVVHLDTEAHDTDTDADTDDRDTNDAGTDGAEAGMAGPTTVHAPPARCFPAVRSRLRFVSSIREVVDAEGVQVISNEIYRPGRDRRAEPSSPLRQETSEELSRFGFEPTGIDVLGFRR